MLITWFQMLKLMFQQRQCDTIEAASQGLIPILNSNFQNRRSGINFMTFGPLIQMPLAQIEIVKEFREGKGRVIYQKVLVCFSVLERENWASLKESCRPFIQIKPRERILWWDSFPCTRCTTHYRDSCH